MYDILTKTIQKLDGELSKKFVNVAEENANARDESGTLITSQLDKQDVDSSKDFETVVDMNGNPSSLNKNEDSHVFISSSYSVIKKK